MVDDAGEKLRCYLNPGARYRHPGKRTRAPSAEPEGLWSRSGACRACFRFAHLHFLQLCERQRLERIISHAEPRVLNAPLLMPASA